MRASVSLIHRIVSFSLSSILTSLCLRPGGTPSPLEKLVKNCPWWEKYPKISFPLGNYIELSSPLGRIQKFWKSPLDFCTVNNRIQNPHSLKARDFPSPLTFGAFILSPLAKKFSPGHWDRGVICQVMNISIKTAALDIHIRLNWLYLILFQFSRYLVFAH